MAVIYLSVSQPPEAPRRRRAQHRDSIAALYSQCQQRAGTATDLEAELCLAQAIAFGNQRFGPGGLPRPVGNEIGDTGNRFQLIHGLEISARS